MMNKHMLAATLAFATLLSLFGAGDWGRAQAQADVTALPDRHVFGLTGIAQGQTLRVSVANGAAPGDPNLPPGPTRVVLMFLDTDGNRVLRRDGTPIRRVVMLETGHAGVLDLHFDDLPPGPSRADVRPVVTIFPQIVDGRVLPPGPTVPSAEIINNANGRTTVVLSNPGVIRGFNPQPDPPRE